ncbi:MAG: hypothetical protein M3O01_15725 [Pseudomonadota bacterium]|nr:hypothetical protein [Pseudomonadota bacterium]
MIDHLFAAALTFCILIGGTLAIGSDFLGKDHASVRTVELAPVVVTAKRFAPPASHVASIDPVAIRAQ